MTPAHPVCFAVLLIGCAPPQAPPAGGARAAPSTAPAPPTHAVAPVDAGRERLCTMQHLERFHPLSLPIPPARDAARMIVTFCRNSVCARAEFEFGELKPQPLPGDTRGPLLWADPARIYGLYRPASDDELRDGDVYELRLERSSGGPPVALVRQVVVYRDPPASLTAEVGLACGFVDHRAAVWPRVE